MVGHNILFLPPKWKWACHIQPITRADFVQAKVFRSRSMNTLAAPRQVLRDNVLRSLEPAFRGEHRTTRFVTSKLDNDRPGLVLAGRPDVSLTKAVAFYTNQRSGQFSSHFRSTYFLNNPQITTTILEICFTINSINTICINQARKMTYNSSKYQLWGIIPFTFPRLPKTTRCRHFYSNFSPLNRLKSKAFDDATKHDISIRL